MIDISQETIALIMLGGVLAGVLTGYPLAPVIAGIALIVGYLTWGGPQVTDLFYSRMWGLIRSYDSREVDPPAPDDLVYPEQEEIGQCHRFSLSRSSFER